jgi:hypothetical protein
MALLFSSGNLFSAVPTLVNTVTTGSLPSFEVIDSANKYLYVYPSPTELQILDVSDPTSTVAITVVDLTPPPSP